MLSKMALDRLTVVEVTGIDFASVEKKEMLSLCHYVIMSLCHYVIMSLCHYVIMSLCHYVILEPNQPKNTPHMTAL
jgi:K+-transporting ATPase A subunit